MNHPVMTLARFRALVEAYGSEPSRWPAAEREAANALLASSEPARALLAQEAELDRALETLPSPDLSPDFLRRLDELPLRTATKQPMRFPFKRLWLPAVGWAAAAALGLALGNFSDDDAETLAEANSVTDLASPEPVPSDSTLASLALGNAFLEEIQ